MQTIEKIRSWPLQFHIVLIGPHYVCFRPVQWNFHYSNQFWYKVHLLSQTKLNFCYGRTYRLSLIYNFLMQTIEKIRLWPLQFDIVLTGPHYVCFRPVQWNFHYSSSLKSILVQSSPSESNKITFLLWSNLSIIFILKSFCSF